MLAIASWLLAAWHRECSRGAADFQPVKAPAAPALMQLSATSALPAAGWQWAGHGRQLAGRTQRMMSLLFNTGATTHGSMER
jgi:hypothetical protein